MNTKILTWAVFCLLISGMVHGAVPQSQREALETLYQNTQGDNWTDNSNWLNGDPCDNEWFGVTCINDKIVEFRLTNNNLVGQIPAAIGDLSDLTVLNLTGNTLFGTIPGQIGNLNQLTSLLLPDNHLTGSIPNSIGNLTNLRSLYLYNNQLTGDIPEEIGQLSQLFVLVLTSNRLSGSIPATMTNLTNLTIFLYEHNALYPENDSLIDFLFLTSCFNNGVFIDCASLSSQTLAPDDFRIESSTETSTTLAWDRSVYAQPGGYQVWMSENENGPYSLVHDTHSKGVTSVEIDSLTAGTQYHFQLRAYTIPHEFNNNVVYSLAIDLSTTLSPDIYYDMQPIHSGSWYNTSQDGHGLAIGILPNGVAVVYWYVFDNDGNQLWLVGAGPFDGKHIQVSMYESRGGLFPPDFNSNDVTTEFWGSLNLTFTSDNTLQYSWIPKSGNGYTPGVLSLQQLTRVNDANTTANRELNPSYSGSLFNSSQSGHGLVVEILPNGIGLIYWYVYDSNGNPIWLVGTGAIDGTDINVEFYTYSGAMFPPNFDSDDLVPTFWGTGRLSFYGCDNALFSWLPDDGNTAFTAGEMNMQRLTVLAGLTCSD